MSSLELLTLTLVLSISIGFIVMLGISLICDKKEEKRKNEFKGEIRCPRCGHEFKYKEEDIIRFTFEGKLHKEVECPRCKNYIEP